MEYIRELFLTPMQSDGRTHAVTDERSYMENRHHLELPYGHYKDCELSWIEIVNKYNKYFCPVGGNGWPKEPPNYIAFRYDGRLQAIHHIDHYTVTRNLHEQFPEMPDEELVENHFVYSLGPAITPSKTVKTGNIYRSGRVWAMLDTLLTCDSISEARDLSYSR